MRYTAFKVRNFKGIRSAELKLGSASGTRIVSVVGLNESGKTTLLEAIHSFRPDESTQTLLYGRTIKVVSPAYLIPKDLEHNFNDTISVGAELVLTEEDVEDIVHHMRQVHGLDIKPDTMPRKFWINKIHKFTSSRHTGTTTEWNFRFQQKTRQAKIWKNHTRDAWDKVHARIQSRLPIIKYYPTFLFEFPEKVHLNEYGSDSINSIYRAVFNDILQHSDPKLSVEEHIVGRVQSKDSGLPFVAALEQYLQSVERRHVESVIARVGATITSVVIKRWNEVFKDKIGNKEVIVDPTFKKSEDGEEVSVAVQFLIKDGTQKYNISERSLGFRWFFCFLMFTQFQAKRADGRSTIFIFDEPASKLHAGAQRQLLDSFARIAQNDNALIYSTHSHHMINPAWLESTYIVENDAVTYTDADYLESWEDKRTEISLLPYRQFVGKFPKKTTYFQPILEALDYAPSDMEFIEPAVLVEGKSDFYALTYFAKIKKLSKLDFMPSAGADDLAPLIALYLGWGKKFVVMWDSDKKGLAAQARYKEEFGLSDHHVTDMKALTGSKELEDFLGSEIEDLVKAHFNISFAPNKKQIMRFFQEKLAMKQDIKISTDLRARLKQLFAGLDGKLVGV